MRTTTGTRSMNATRHSLVAIAIIASCTCAVPALSQDAAPKDAPPGIEELKARAEGGDRIAARRVAEAYYAGRGAEQDFKEAARWYEIAAKRGDRIAQTTLGLMYVRGFGVARSVDGARRWWTLAAMQNDPGAQYNLGRLYHVGDGLEKDFTQAARWYREAAMRGHVQAQHNLGMMHRNGDGVEKDLVRAYYWIRVAALQGDDVAEGEAKKLGATMSPEQLREGEAQAQEWMKRAKKIYQ